MNKFFNLVFLCFAIIMLQAHSAHAIFELKAGYGTLASKVNLGNFYGGEMPSAIPSAGLTLDARVIIPFVGLGVGLRTEDQKIGYSSSLIGIDNSFKRTSLVVNYRIIDTLLHVGPVFTMGMSHSNKIRLDVGGSPAAEISSSSVSSSSLGLEVSAGLLGFSVGAEVGYMNMKYKDAKDSLGSGMTADLDMSGSYAKVLVGFGI